MRVLKVAAAGAGAVALVLGGTPTVQAAPAPPGQYVVVLTPGADSVGVAAEQGRRLGFTARHVYRYALHGFAARLSGAAVDALRHDPRVQSVMPDLPFAASATSSTQVLPTGIRRIGADRSSTRSGDGRGSVAVNVAVLDTGIDPAHPDLNVAGGVVCNGKTWTDAQGHGTHVGGTIAARDDGQGVVGVAPGARLWGVKVLNDSGSGNAGDIICGIDWVTGTRLDADPTNDVAVANMSLGGKGADDGTCGNATKDALHQAICRSTAAGVTYVVSAGNSTNDVADFAPAAYHEVLTVAAVADFDGLPGALHDPVSGECGYTHYTDDTAAFFSGFATTAADQAHVIAAPGACILSTWTGSTYARASGTSMASPHVAGVAALCIASGPCAGLTPAQVIAKLRADASAYLTAQPTSGFAGDPLHPVAGRYYGPLVRAAGY